jgi:crotonobetainyl-CoA:carnitine CoA-transferase CaiB-like acyl-CoA transferase
MPALDGLKVVDLTRVLAGPFCTMLLGDMGADVIKVEEPEHGDDSRDWAPFIAEGWSSYFVGVNRNKRSLALNL